MVIKNIVEVGDLLNEQEYTTVKEDIREECARMGVLKSIEIPRPLSAADARPQVGKVFLEYAKVEDAVEAKKVEYISCV